MKKNKAFTLIELIVALVILAIIAVITIPIVLNIIEKTEISARKRSIDAYGKAVELAISMHKMNYGYYPDNFNNLEVKYSGSNVKCNEQILNKNGSIYLSKCYVDSVKVKDENGWYSYGKIISDYVIGDVVTYNGMKFYVINNSNTSIDYVTLLKAEPLTVDEVNKYGVGHINKYTELNQGVAHNYNGYGGMTYYSSEKCGYVNGSDISTECTNSYDSSDIKYVVDAWALNNFKDSDLKEDTLNYKARLLTLEELQDNLGYDISVSTIPSQNGETPTWVYNEKYYYWTMSPYGDYNLGMWMVSSEGNVHFFHHVFLDGTGTVRPVVNLSKDVIY